MAKITIVDVARLAGVSTATVSRAMHSPSALRPATLERVRAVMEEHGYVYNATAGDFSRRKSTVIGVLVLTHTHKVSSALNAIQEIATDNGFPLITCTSGFNPRLERKHIQQFLERGVAGVLVIDHLIENRSKLDELQLRGIPCVFLWDSMPGTEYSFVGIDNEDACFAMVSHLAGQGHRRIGFMCGVNAGVERINKRFNGYKAALEAHGIPFDATLICPVTSSFENGKSAMQTLMSLRHPPHAVACASDVLAMGAISAAYEAGFAVPGNVAVMGFDNSELAPYTCPPLSTVDVPGVEMGRLGINALMTLINDPNHPCIQQTLETSLVLRTSSRPVLR